jgi:hypothetical protein
MGVAAVMVINFLQLPIFYSAFFIYFDCVVMRGASGSTNVLRVDFREECSGDDYNFFLASSVGGIVVWKVFMPCLFLVALKSGGRDEHRKLGVDTSHSAYVFLVAGLKPTRWWFTIWKMVLKEITPLLVVILNIGGEPVGYGYGNAPATLASVGVVVVIIHTMMKPYDNDRPMLVKMEFLSWLAFISAPMTRMLIGLEAVAATYQGDAYVTRFIAPLTNWSHWFFMSVSILLYMSVFIVGVIAIFAEEFQYWEPPKIIFTINERLHLRMPSDEKHRMWVAQTVAEVFQVAMDSHMDKADEAPGGHLAPGALLESTLLLVAKEQAKEDGIELGPDGNEIAVDRNQFQVMMDRVMEGMESDRLVDHRAVLDPGGYAEATLGAGLTKGKGKGTQPHRGGGKGKGPPLPTSIGDNDPSSSASATASVSSPSKQDTEVEDLDRADGYNNGLHIIAEPGEPSVIMFSYAVECVDLKSFGFRAGQGSAQGDVRKGVQAALQRGVAAASACGEAEVEATVHPVGMDRILVIAIVHASGSDADVQLRIREEWLRNTLGTREGRSRWGKAVEQDLLRVGASSAPGMKMQVRFTRGSRPQRMLESLAISAAEATVAAASAA